jgi:uncharacterized LabA/DUF88 family protein
MKTAIFIDGANNHHACKAINLIMDYSRLLPYFNKDRTLLRAFYYTAILPDHEGMDRMRPLTDWLDYNGYAIVTKMSKTFNDPLTGLTKVKGNMDMEMAVDALLMADHADSIILFTGDGDFSYLVRALQQKGVRVTVVSTLCEGMNKPPMIADELRRACDHFIDLHDIREAIRRPNV